MLNRSDAGVRRPLLDELRECRKDEPPTDEEVEAADCVEKRLLLSGMSTRVPLSVYADCPSPWASAERRRDGRLMVWREVRERTTSGSAGA